MTYKTISQKLESARLLIYNSEDPAIAPLLVSMGVDNNYINKGKALYNEATRLIARQREEYQERSLGYDKFYVAKTRAERDFNRTLRMVKILSRNDTDLQDRLGIRSGKVHAIEPWIESSIDLYQRLLKETDLLTRLHKFRITTRQLQNEQKAIEDLKQLRNDAIAGKGQAQHATELRNKKLDELEDYTSELRTLARIALEDRSQLLEKLGILVRS